MISDTTEDHSAPSTPLHCYTHLLTYSLSYLFWVPSLFLSLPRGRRRPLTGHGLSSGGILSHLARTLYLSLHMLLSIPVTSCTPVFHHRLPSFWMELEEGPWQIHLDLGLNPVRGSNGTTQLITLLLSLATSLYISLNMSNSPTYTINGDLILGDHARVFYVKHWVKTLS